MVLVSTKNHDLWPDQEAGPDFPSTHREFVRILSQSFSSLGSISSRYGSPVILLPTVGQGTRAHKTAGNRAYLVPRGRAPFGQHQESRPLAMSNAGSPRFTDFPLLCACSESSLTNLIGSGLNPFCLQSHSKTECRWTGPEVAILGADQKERGLWGRECQPIRLADLTLSMRRVTGSP